MDMYIFLESARQGAADELIKNLKNLTFFPVLLGRAQNFEPHARCDYDG